MFVDETKRINMILNNVSQMSKIQFIEREVIKFKISPVRRDMITGEAYYLGEHKILKRKRKAIGEGGRLTEICNLPNNRIVDNLYAKMVDQKNNYLLAKPIIFLSENKEYMKEIKKIFNRKVLRTIRRLGEDCINGGIGWLYIYYDENGNIDFKTFKPYEILPFWKDSEHTILDLVVRLYCIDVYDGNTERIIEKAEIYDENGIQRFNIENGKLIPDVENSETSYIKDSNGNDFSWGKIPIIPFKQNSKEIPLIKRVKSLQDAINTMKSDFMNNMQEDSRNTILVLKNYDGTNLGEFRKNLSEFGVVKVKSIDGADGGVETLSVNVDSNNYSIILDMLKKALIENARGFDARDERFSSNPNQMNIKSMYADIDIDADGMENEFQASFEELFYFVNSYLLNSNKGNFFEESINVIFNRDVIINETEAIDNCQKSIGLLSNRSIIVQHPWVSDIQAEYDALGI